MWVRLKGKVYLAYFRGKYNNTVFQPNNENMNNKQIY